MRKYVHEVLANRLGSLSLPRKSVVRLTDRPDMTLAVNRGRKITTQQGIYGLKSVHSQLGKREDLAIMDQSLERNSIKCFSLIASKCPWREYLINSLYHTGCSKN